MSDSESAATPADHLFLLAPSANRVYAGGAAPLVAAELNVLLGDDRLIEPVTLAGVEYLALPADASELPLLGRASAGFALYARSDDRLIPTALPRPELFDDDLVTIPKYPGKTNEQFTRLLVNLTLASVTRAAGPRSLLDPLCGRGTTLSTGLILGCDVAGVDSDAAAVEAYASYLKTYLRRKRLKHSADVTPVRREGKTLGKRLDVTVTPAGGDRSLGLTVFTGDTRASAALFGRRRFDAIVADAPYGVVHGGARSAAGLIAEALPVWAGQLKTGGALGLAWNTLGLAREALVDLARAAGLDPLDNGPFHRFAHRVDSSIHRDVLVARKL